MPARSGRCLCGGVRFTAESVETHHHACHCGMCRRWAGGPLFAAPAKAVSFASGENLSTYASSSWAERGFCRICGSSLFYRLKETGHYFMCVGAFDDASQFTLAGEICIDQKPAGYALAGDHPRLTEAEAFARLAGG